MTGPSARAIIIAAGRGRRLGVETADLPKCMVRVAGRPILHWQLDALSGAGIRDVVIVRGYLGDRIDAGSHTVRFVDNPGWMTNNILASLLHAEADFTSGFFFSYADIVFAPNVVACLAEAARTTRADGLLVVDRSWQAAYVGRTLHPVEEAELALVTAQAEPGEDAREPTPRVNRVGKTLVTADQAAGEFIGLGWLSARAAQALKAAWRSALAQGGLEAPFGHATALRTAYLTDALNALIHGPAFFAPGPEPLFQPVYIDGQWREIDTEQDLARAHEPLAAWAVPA